MFSNNQDTQCATNTNGNNEAVPFAGSVTIHDLLMYIAIGCMALTIITSGWLISGHIRNYHQPHAQKHIIRIILTAPFYAIASCVGVASYASASYLESVMQLYGAFTFFSLFMLEVAYLKTFDDWETRTSKWFRVAHLAVMQLVPVKLILMVVDVVVTSIECSTDKSWQKIAVGVAVLNISSTASAIAGSLPFSIKQRQTLRQVDPKMTQKFITSQTLVIGQTLVSMVTSVLSKMDKLEPTSDHVSYNDLNIGVPMFAINILAFVTAILMIPAFEARRCVRPADAGKEDLTAVALGTDSEGAAIENSSQSAHVQPALGGRRAIWDTVNITDVGYAIVGSFKRAESTQ